MIHFTIQMVLNKEILYQNCFLTLFYNMWPGRLKKIKKEWNSMEHISFWYMLKMLIYWAKYKYQKETQMLY